MASNKIITIEKREDLDYAYMHGELYGYIPAVKIDTNTLEFPLKFELFPELKVFRLYQEPEPATPAEPQKTKKKLSKGAIAGIVCGCIALLAIIIGLAVGLSGCATKLKCVEYNGQGICTAEEVNYRVRAGQ